MLNTEALKLKLYDELGGAAKLPADLELLSPTRRLVALVRRAPRPLRETRAPELMKRGAAIAEYVPCEFEVCEISGKVRHYTSPPPNPHPHKVLCLKNIPRGSRKTLPSNSLSFSLQIFEAAVCPTMSLESDLPPYALAGSAAPVTGRP